MNETRPPLDWQKLAEQLAQRMTPLGGVQTITLQNAAGRVLAAPVYSAHDLPMADEAVMDGYALGSAPPGAYRVATGQMAALEPDQAMLVQAGGALPAHAVAVVMARRAQLDGELLHVKESAPRDNIRRAGEEIMPGALIAQAGQMLEPRRLALLASTGVRSVTVRPRARVALLGMQPATAHMQVLRALLDAPAIHLTEAGAATDVASSLAQLAREHDLIVVTGPSLGDEAGQLVNAIATAGGKAKVMRAALKPAKPLISGMIGQAAIVGLGGTPYAVGAAAHLFLAPALAQLIQLTGWAHPLLPARAGFARPREQGRAEALPVCVQTGGESLRLALAGRFGQLTALAALDGFALVDKDAAGIVPGDQISFLRWRSPLLP